ncbi:MAG: LEPR-XLL domain-containing protein, partial [Pseudomonadota bacterium]
MRSRLRRRDPRRLKSLTEAARRLTLDPLEPRILLNADVLALDMAALSPERRDADLLVRMLEETQQQQDASVVVQRVEVLDRDGGALLAFGDLSEISAVSILGGEGDESVIVDAASFGDALIPELTFDGGGGLDLFGLQGADDMIWTIDALDSGSAMEGLNRFIFSDVENLEGAAGNEDSFVVVGDAGLSGLVEGGDGGFDVLTFEGGGFQSLNYQVDGPQSGVILRDDDPLAFSGFEPIFVTPANGTPQAGSSFTEFSVQLSADDDPDAVLSFASGFFTLGSATNTFESISFEMAPSGSITIDGADGTDAVSIASFDPNFRGTLTVEAEAITVEQAARIGDGVAGRLQAVILSAEASDSDASATGAASATAAASVDVLGEVSANIVSLSATA